MFEYGKFASVECFSDDVGTSTGSFNLEREIGIDGNGAIAVSEVLGKRPKVDERIRII